MKLNYFLALIPFVILSCNSSNTKGIKYDVSIKKEVIKNIDSQARLNKSITYDNSLLIEYFEDDSLTLSTFNKQQKLIFKSKHTKVNDTIVMEGSYGVLGGYGYLIKLHNNEVEVYYAINSDEVPAPYTLTQEGEDFTNTIKVPVEDYNITFSSAPKGTLGEIIYGVVEFKSQPYYKMDFNSLHRKQKINTNMKVYFRSLGI